MRSFDEWFDENCDGSDLAKDACRKLWNEFSDQINIICRKSYEKQQSKVDELERIIELRDQQLTEEIALSTKYVGKFDELQKRVDAVKQLIEEYRDPPTEDKTFQHALSIVAYELEQALKDGENE